MDPQGDDPDENYIETVLTCKGNFYDPQFHHQLSHFSNTLQKLIHPGPNGLILKKVEPWNSVRVTFNIPREAAVRLKFLAENGDHSLKDLGILSVQIQGGCAISLTLRDKDNRPTEIVLRTPAPSLPTPITTSNSSANFVHTSDTTPGSNSNQNVEAIRKNIAQYLRQQGTPGTSLLDTLFNPSHPSARDVNSTPINVPLQTHVDNGASNYPTPPPSHPQSQGITSPAAVGRASPASPHFPTPPPQQQSPHQNQTGSQLLNRPVTMQRLAVNNTLSTASPLLVNLLKTDKQGGQSPIVSVMKMENPTDDVDAILTASIRRHITEHTGQDGGLEFDPSLFSASAGTSSPAIVSQALTRTSLNNPVSGKTSSTVQSIAQTLAPQKPSIVPPISDQMVNNVSTVLNQVMQIVNPYTGQMECISSTGGSVLKESKMLNSSVSSLHSPVTSSLSSLHKPKEEKRHVFNDSLRKPTAIGKNTELSSGAKAGVLNNSEFLSLTHISAASNASPTPSNTMPNITAATLSSVVSQPSRIATPPTFPIISSTHTFPLSSRGTSHLVSSVASVSSNFDPAVSSPTPLLPESRLENHLPSNANSMDKIQLVASVINSTVSQDKVPSTSSQNELVKCHVQSNNDTKDTAVLKTNVCEPIPVAETTSSSKPSPSHLLKSVTICSETVPTSSSTAHVTENVNNMPGVPSLTVKRTTIPDLSPGANCASTETSSKSSIAVESSTASKSLVKNKTDSEHFANSASHVESGIVSKTKLNHLLDPKNTQSCASVKRSDNSKDAQHVTELKDDEALTQDIEACVLEKWKSKSDSVVSACNDILGAKEIVDEVIVKAQDVRSNLETTKVGLLTVEKPCQQDKNIGYPSSHPIPVNGEHSDSELSTDGLAPESNESKPNPVHLVNGDDPNAALRSSPVIKRHSVKSTVDANVSISAPVSKNNLDIPYSMSAPLSVPLSKPEPVNPCSTSMKLSLGNPQVTKANLTGIIPACETLPLHFDKIPLNSEGRHSMKERLFSEFKKSRTPTSSPKAAITNKADAMLPLSMRRPASAPLITSGHNEQEGGVTSHAVSLSNLPTLQTQAPIFSIVSSVSSITDMSPPKSTTKSVPSLMPVQVSPVKVANKAMQSVVVPFHQSPTAMCLSQTRKSSSVGSVGYILPVSVKNIASSPKKLADGPAIAVQVHASTISPVKSSLSPKINCNEAQSASTIPNGGPAEAIHGHDYSATEPQTNKSGHSKGVSILKPLYERDTLLEAEIRKSPVAKRKSKKDQGDGIRNNSPGKGSGPYTVAQLLEEASREQARKAALEKNVNSDIKSSNDSPIVSTATSGRQTLNNIVHKTHSTSPSRLYKNKIQPSQALLNTPSSITSPGFHLNLTESVQRVMKAIPCVDTLSPPSDSPPAISMAIASSIPTSADSRPNLLKASPPALAVAPASMTTAIISMPNDSHVAEASKPPHFDENKAKESVKNDIKFKNMALLSSVQSNVVHNVSNTPVISREDSPLVSKENLRNSPLPTELNSNASLSSLVASVSEIVSPQVSAQQSLKIKEEHKGQQSPKPEFPKTIIPTIYKKKSQEDKSHSPTLSGSKIIAIDSKESSEEKKVNSDVDNNSSSSISPIVDVTDTKSSTKSICNNAIAIKDAICPSATQPSLLTNESACVAALSIDTKTEDRLDSGIESSSTDTPTSVDSCPVLEVDSGSGALSTPVSEQKSPMKSPSLGSSISCNPVLHAKEVHSLPDVLLDHKGMAKERDENVNITLPDAIENPVVKNEVLPIKTVKAVHDSDSVIRHSSASMDQNDKLMKAGIIAAKPTESVKETSKILTNEIGGNKNKDTLSSNPNEVKNSAGVARRRNSSGSSDLSVASQLSIGKEDSTNRTNTRNRKKSEGSESTASDTSEKRSRKSKSPPPRATRSSSRISKPPTIYDPDGNDYGHKVVTKPQDSTDETNVKSDESKSIDSNPKATRSSKRRMASEEKQLAPIVEMKVSKPNTRTNNKASKVSVPVKKEIPPPKISPVEEDHSYLGLRARSTTTETKNDTHMITKITQSVRGTRASEKRTKPLTTDAKVIGKIDLQKQENQDSDNRKRRATRSSNKSTSKEVDPVVSTPSKRRRTSQDVR